MCLDWNVDVRILDRRHKWPTSQDSLVWSLFALKQHCICSIEAHFALLCVSMQLMSKSSCIRFHGRWRAGNLALLLRCAYA